MVRFKLTQRKVFFGVSALNFFEGGLIFKGFFLRGALFLRVAREWFLFRKTETNSNDV